MRKLCWCALPFCIAVFLSVYLLPSKWLFAAGLLAAALCLLGLPLRRGLRRRLVCIGVGMAVGFLWTGLYGYLFRTPARGLVSNEAVTYTLTVTGFPGETNRGAVFPARLQLDGALDPKVRVYGEASAMELRPGDEITAPLRLSASDLYHGKDYNYYEAKGIYLLGNMGDGFTLVSRPAHPPLSVWPQYAAKALKDSLARSFPADVSGFAAALITGDKAQLPTGLYTAFQRSGIAHVVAVSGLHISFLVGLLSMALRKRSKLSAVLILLPVFFFTALTGNSPSALRAAFMAAFLLIAPLVRREEDKATTLSAVLTLLLVQCPYAAASVSLQLSFTAIAGIYLITTPLYTQCADMIPQSGTFLGCQARKILLFCVGTLATTFGALLFTLPLSAIHFRSVSLAGPLTNLLTLWMISGVFLGCLLTAVLGLFLPGPAAMLGALIAWPIRWIQLTAGTISRLPFAAIALRSGYLIFWFVIVYTILLVCVFSRSKPRPALPAAALLLCLCVAAAANTVPARTGRLTAMVLDVGQGASTLLYSEGHAVLVDCGGNGEDAGNVAADYLQSLGCAHLDALILTHCHTDHANGVPELLERLDVSMIVAPDTGEEESLRKEIFSIAKDKGCKVELLREDRSTQFGGASLTLYAPLGDGGINEAGLTVLCTADEYDVLITGDMNSVVERKLVNQKCLPDIELLVAGHHGSKSSTSKELLLRTKPEAAVISSGYNTYGHPAPETLARLEAMGCEVYRTDLMGTVTFTFGGK